MTSVSEHNQVIYDRAMDESTGITPSFCGQCSATCRGCLKEQYPDHPINNVHYTKPMSEADQPDSHKPLIEHTSRGAMFWITGMALTTLTVITYVLM